MHRGRWALVGLLLSAGVAAEPSAGVTSIWYRSSDTCPDGDSFLQRLSQLGRSARLAGAGDPIDFVVTLGAGDTGSFGRLERQAERGTVAMRSVAAHSCEEVADALALSLDLALDPSRAAEVPAPAEPDAAAPPSASPPAAPVRASEPEKPIGTGPGSSTANALVPREEASIAAPEPAGFRLGAQGMLVTGVAGAPLWGGAMFGELTVGAVTPRLSVLGAVDASEVDDYTLRVRLFAARIEGCAWQFGPRKLYVQPCVGVDVGIVEARYQGPSGGKDAGAWVSPTLLGRGVWSVVQSLSVVAQIGVYIPLFRYDVGAPEEAPLASTDPVGLSAAVGLAVAL